IYFNQQSAIPSRASGILRKQDPSAFSLSALATNYALALDGWETSNGSLKHYALAGAFALNAGNISNGFCDANEGGHVLNSGGFWGTIPSIATADGNGGDGPPKSAAIEDVSALIRIAKAVRDVPGVQRKRAR